MNRQQAAWLHRNVDVDSTEADVYPFANIVNDINSGLDALNVLCTVLIVLAVVGLILVGVCR